MSDNNEKLSAFLDDGLDDNETLSATVHDGETLHRYNLIGEAMRGELNEASMMDISAQVRQAIESETAHQAATTARKSTPFAAWFDMSSWLQPVGGLAIAASVAMIAVVTLDQEAVTDGPAAGTPVAEIQPVGQPLQAQVESPAVRAVASNADQTEGAPAQADFNLEQYLNEHSEFAASDTLQGRLPYVRAVGYKNESR